MMTTSSSRVKSMAFSRLVLILFILLIACLPQKGAEISVIEFPEESLNPVTGAPAEFEEDELEDDDDWSATQSHSICQTCPVEIGPFTVYKFPKRISIPRPEP